MAHNPYLRQLRVRWSLSQHDLATLLNISQGSVSRYEQGSEHPPLLIVLALHVIFGARTQTMFPALYEVAEERVMARAAELERSVRNLIDPASMRKKHLLESMVARASKSFQV